VTSHARLDRSTVSEARDGLRRVLEAIRKEELTAGPGYVARLEGAIAALDPLLEQSRSRDPVDTPSL
jgi:hypothetical protein